MAFSNQRVLFDMVSYVVIGRTRTMRTEPRKTSKVCMPPLWRSFGRCIYRLADPDIFCHFPSLYYITVLVAEVSGEKVAEFKEWSSQFSLRLLCVRYS